MNSNLSPHQFDTIRRQMETGQHLDTGVESYGGILHIHDRPYPHARKIPSEVVFGKPGEGGEGPGQHGRERHAFEFLHEGGGRLHVGWREGDPRVLITEISARPNISKSGEHHPQRVYTSMRHTASDVPDVLRSFGNIGSTTVRPHYWWDRR